ncbi:MAG: hypothetical protein ABSB49_15605 [Polyangia bacterium]|jgi:hypothetical protein
MPRGTTLCLRKRLAAALLGLAMVAVFACNSPFIPIPPPNPTFGQVSADNWSVTMPPDGAAIGATYFILNARLGSGIIQEAAGDGSVFAQPLQGQVGDSIYIHWERGTDTSSVLCRPLGPGLVQTSCQ